MQSAYLSDWFEVKDNGDVMFYIPVTGATGVKTDLIGTRHRLAVILPHLEVLPIAIATGHLTPEGRSLLQTIPKTPLSLSSPFWLPDFPICDSLP